VARNQITLTDAITDAFINGLAKTGSPTAAAKLAHPAKNGINSFRSLRERSPAFASQWDQALKEFASGVLAEVKRRAIDGWSEAVYQKGQRVYEYRIDPATGKRVRVPANIRRYDSALLQKLVAALPKGALENALDFNPARQIQHSGVISHDHVHRREFVLAVEDLQALSPAQTENLQDILRTIALARGEEQPKALEYTNAKDAEYEEVEPVEKEEWELVGEQQREAANG
jgi:hypothetical protein